jgi:hypothetical protein
LRCSRVRIGSETAAGSGSAASGEMDSRSSILYGCNRSRAVRWGRGRDRPDETVGVSVRLDSCGRRGLPGSALPEPRTDSTFALQHLRTTLAKHSGCPPSASTATLSSASSAGSGVSAVPASERGCHGRQVDHECRLLQCPMPIPHSFSTASEAFEDLCFEYGLELDEDVRARHDAWPSLHRVGWLQLAHTHARCSPSCPDLGDSPFRAPAQAQDRGACQQVRPALPRRTRPVAPRLPRAGTAARLQGGPACDGSRGAMGRSAEGGACFCATLLRGRGGPC